MLPQRRQHSTGGFRSDGKMLSSHGICRKSRPLRATVWPFDSDSLAQSPSQLDGPDRVQSGCIALGEFRSSPKIPATRRGSSHRMTRLRRSVTP
jgi:hypothetical protein